MSKMDSTNNPQSNSNKEQKLYSFSPMLPNESKVALVKNTNDESVIPHLDEHGHILQAKLTKISEMDANFTEDLLNLNLDEISKPLSLDLGRDDIHKSLKVETQELSNGSDHGLQPSNQQPSSASEDSVSPKTDHSGEFIIVSPKEMSNGEQEKLEKDCGIKSEDHHPLLNRQSSDPFPQAEFPKRAKRIASFDGESTKVTVHHPRSPVLEEGEPNFGNRGEVQGVTKHLTKPSPILPESFSGSPTHLVIQNPDFNLEATIVKGDVNENLIKPFDTHEPIQRVIPPLPDDKPTEQIAEEANLIDLGEEAEVKIDENIHSNDNKHESSQNKGDHSILNTGNDILKSIQPIQPIQSEATPAVRDLPMVTHSLDSEVVTPVQDLSHVQPEKGTVEETPISNLNIPQSTSVKREISSSPQPSKKALKVQFDTQDSISDDEDDDNQVTDDEDVNYYQILTLPPFPKRIPSDELVRERYKQQIIFAQFEKYEIGADPMEEKQEVEDTDMDEIEIRLRAITESYVILTHPQEKLRYFSHRQHRHSEEFDFDESLIPRSYDLIFCNVFNNELVQTLFPPRFFFIPISIVLGYIVGWYFYGFIGLCVCGYLFSYVGDWLDTRPNCSTITKWNSLNDNQRKAVIHGLSHKVL